MRNLILLAKYPFLEDAKTYIKDNGPTIEDLLTNILYERARTIGIERLNNAIDKRDVGNRTLATTSDYTMELLSYPIARMITACLNDTYFKRRYALAEASHAYKNLLTEPNDFLITIATELHINATPIENSNNNHIHFTDYLKHAPTRYKEWKMINRDMHHGNITITRKDLARIILEALRKRLNQELDHLTCNTTIKTIFKTDLQRYQHIINQQKKQHETTPIGTLTIDKLPPCMKDILTAIQAGENVPHMGRFALVAYLNTLKLTTEEIRKLFSTAPDFEEDKTRYQIEHITGKTSSTSYKSPACDKMKTYGICPQEKIDDLCKTIHHPLTYYHARWKQEKKP